MLICVILYVIIVYSRKTDKYKEEAMLDIKNVLMVTMIILSIAMIIVVLPQESKQNQPQIFVEDNQQAYFKPKGKEAFLNKLTRIVSILFFINALALVVVMKG